MTPTQLTTFKTALLADGTISAALAAGDHGSISNTYNNPASGFYWRSNISISELNTAIVWSEFAALSVALQNTYMALIQGGVDATNANIRSGFGTVFSGTSLTNLTALAKKVPTKFEALFTTSNICALSGTSVTPALIAEALRS